MFEIIRFSNKLLQITSMMKVEKVVVTFTEVSCSLGKLVTDHYWSKNYFFSNVFLTFMYSIIFFLLK